MGRILVVGSLNADLVCRAERLPTAGETLTGGDLDTFPGGKGANQALAAARLGVATTLAGAVGVDALGDLVLASQREAGVSCTGVRRSDRPTGVALITVLPDGRNAILLSPGANASVSAADAREACQTLGPGDVLLCQLEIPVEAVIAALGAARDRGATTILDPAPAQPLDEGALALADILSPNETEAATLTRLPLSTPPETVAAELQRRGAGAVILKLGSRGCFVHSQGTAVSLPALEVEAVDTTAAGDVFNAALAVCLVEGKDLETAARFATAASAVSVTRMGAQPSAPTRAEVEAMRTEGETARR